jgi:hypothetical protein
LNEKADILAASHILIDRELGHSNLLTGKFVRQKSISLVPRTQRRNHLFEKLILGALTCLFFAYVRRQELFDRS